MERSAAGNWYDHYHKKALKAHRRALSQAIALSYFNNRLLQNSATQIVGAIGLTGMMTVAWA